MERDANSGEIFITQEAIMNMNLRKAYMALMLLSMSSLSNADLIYEFECTVPGCGNSSDFVGTFTFADDTDRINGAVAGNILAFNASDSFISDVWNLGHLVGTDARVYFSSDFKKIIKFESLESIDNVIDALQFSNGGRKLGVFAEGVRLQNVLDVLGAWKLKVDDGPGDDPDVVNEPTSFAIFALGLMGLAVRRFKNQS